MKIMMKIIWEEHEDWNKLEENMVGQRRWVTEYSGIYQHLPSNKVYRFLYDVPSTETCGDLVDVIFGEYIGTEVEIGIRTMEYWKDVE